MKEFGDKNLVNNIFHTIKAYHKPSEDEVKVKWESEWTNMNQVNPWFAKIVNSGKGMKRIFVDCKSEYSPADKKLVRKIMDTNLKVGTIVEYVEAGNSKRTQQYFGIITKYGLYRVGEVDDPSTIEKFMTRYNDDVLGQLTEEHELILDM